MGSFQQISLGLVCLFAAFAFGNYVNNYPADDQHPLVQTESGDLAVQPVGNVQSRLTDSPFDVVNRRPAPIATMRKPLKPRFPMPLDAQIPAVPRMENKLPPPSQLANQVPPESVETRPWLKPNNHESVDSAKVNDIPDFSAIAREFRNNPIELPTLGLMPSVGSPSDSAVTPPLEPVAPLKKLADRTHRVGADTINPTTAHHPSTTDVHWKASPRFSADHFSPKLTRREATSKPDSSIVPKEHLARIPNYSNPASGVATFKPPIEPAHSNHVISKQAAPIDIYRGSLTSVPGEELADARSSNRVRTMLPFGLTDEAKSRLVAIRSDANSRISLNTTRFVDHVVKRGETLQSISIRYFGNPDYYLDIYLANRNKLRNPVDVRQGMFLRVPVYQ